MMWPWEEYFKVLKLCFHLVPFFHAGNRFVQAALLLDYGHTEVLTRDLVMMEAVPVPVLPRPTMVSVEAPLSRRFLLEAENQSIPLCFDITGNVQLKLLHSPSRELSVNGELDSVAGGGFTKIVIHVKPDLYIDIDVNEILVRDGQTLTRHTGEEQITAGSVTVIKRNKEVDVATGDIRIVILLHERHGEKFLWPVLRQHPPDNNAEGILALKPAVYEELQQTPSSRLMINGQEVDVDRSDAVDYSIVRPPKRGCWLVSADAALQRPLDDFIV